MMFLTIISEPWLDYFPQYILYSMGLNPYLSFDQ